MSAHYTRAGREPKGGPAEGSGSVWLWHKHSCARFTRDARATLWTDPLPGGM